MANRLTQLTIKPSMAWLLVFVPALSYFVATRLQSSGFRWGRSNSLGEKVTSSLQIMSSSCATLSSEVFYTNQPCDDDQRVSLQHTLNLLFQGRGMKDIVASTWRHDEELGRGYLLFSQAHGNGRVWRWEVGGGPIAIGRSLHLEASGCRSSLYHSCEEQQQHAVGSGGLAIDFHHGSESDRYSEGSLVVAEWGEGRIIRMEESNGARTPLIIQVPNLCASNTAWKRLRQPRSLLYTPYGDLLVADVAPDCKKAGIFRLSQAVHVPALESLSQSREAHGWNQTQHSFQIDTLYHQNVQQIGGMSMDPTWLNLVATVQEGSGRVLLVQIPTVTEEEEDSDDDKPDGEDQVTEDDNKDEAASTAEASADEEQVAGSSSARGVMDDKVNVLLDLTQELGVSEPGALVVSEKGHIFVAVSEGVAILSGTTFQVLGLLKTPQRPTALTLGGDKFLYAFSDDSVFRIKVRLGPVAVPTNLVVGKK